VRSVRGSILIVVLFVMTALSLSAVGFAYRASLNRAAILDRAVLSRLKAQAASAAHIAMAELAADVNDFDHPAESWCAHPSLASQDWLAEWQSAPDGRPPEFVTDYAVIDEEGKLNVLYASSTAMEGLGMSPEQIDSLLDWIDADGDARPQGAEDDFYQRRQEPYHCKNAPLEALEELLWIRGFARGDYLGEDADHDGELDSCEDDGTLSDPPDNADGKLQLGWVDVLTCVGDGRINLNTAPRKVLEALPLSRCAADQICAYRAFDADSSGQLEDHAFRCETDIDQLQGIEDADRDVLKLMGKFHSETFRIFVRSRHVPTGLTYRLQILVRRSDGGVEVLQWMANP